MPLHLRLSALLRTAVSSLALLAAGTATGHAQNTPFQLRHTYHLPLASHPIYGTVSMIAGEFSQDSWPDLLVATAEMPLVMLVGQNAARGGFLPKTMTMISNYLAGPLDRNVLSAGGVDDAGRTRELFFPQDLHTVRYLQWVGGAGNFVGSAQRIELPPVAGDTGELLNLASGDFNGDTRTDLAMVDRKSDNSFDGRTLGVIAWGPGGGSVERTVPTVANPYYIDAGEYIGDASHRPDLLTASRIGNIALTIYDTTNSRFVLTRTLTEPNGAIYSMVGGDFNGDGLRDALAMTVADGNTLWRVIENRGAQGLQLGSLVPITVSRSTCVGDFDGDGRTDVLADGEALYLGRGNYTFDAPLNVADPGLVYSTTCADFNRDGRLDFASVREPIGGGLMVEVHMANSAWDRLFANGFN